MEVIDVSIKVVILALVTFSGPQGTASHFQCNNPDEWFSNIGLSSFFPFQRWPNGTVTYFLNTTLTSSDLIIVWQSIFEIQNKTCIRFVPRAENDSSYVSIEHDDNVCGLANVCKLGRYQFARFGNGCLDVNTIVHELGHTLCLAHEQSRKDRDDYVHLDDVCNGELLLPKDNFETRGYLYDYTSQMHYNCHGCFVGYQDVIVPTMEGVSKCGPQVQNGLSVLDADKLNDFYDCQGCFSHRWRRTENLTDVEKGELVSFGKNAEYKDLYLCRTYVGPGEIAPGRYDRDNNLCTVTFDGVVYQVKDKVQVFTVPDDSGRKSYGISDVNENLVDVGRTRHGLTIYAAVAEYTDYEGRYGQVIGKVYANDFTKAYFSIYRTVVTKTRFLVIVCH